MNRLSPFLLIGLLCFAGCGDGEISSTSQQTEARVEVPPPEPTSRETLLKLQDLGARWKRNKHGQVNWLYLKRLPIADDDLAILEELPEIQLLHMRGIQTIKGHRFTNAGLLHVLSLKKLRHLDLSANYDLTDECSATLKQLTSLKTLNLSWTSITAASLPNLSQLKSLEFLNVTEIPLDENTIDYFEQMSLRELSGIEFSEASYPLLPRLSHLEEPLFWEHEIIKDTNLVHLRHISKIKLLEVILTKGGSDTSHLKHLQDLPELEYLCISQKQISKGPIDSSGLHSLAKIPTLKRIDAGRVDDRFLEALSHCTQVTHLDLVGLANEVTPTGLRCLKNMRSLKKISLERPLARDKTF